MNPNWGWFIVGFSLVHEICFVQKSKDLKPCCKKGKNSDDSELIAQLRSLTWEEKQRMQGPEQNFQWFLYLK